MKKPVYLDYNATTPLDPEVAEVMMPFIKTDFGNPSSGYSAGQIAKEAVEKARGYVANLINCHPEEIIFTSGGTESNNLAIKGVAASLNNKGKHIITSSIEHPSVINVCRFLQDQGFEVTYLPVDRHGSIKPDDVKKAIREDTILITVMHANNEVGTIQPIHEISRIARSNNILIHTDASQSIGKIETDVEIMGVDLLTIAGHKLYAPKGVGALYIRHGVQIENLMQGAGQEKGLRPGTENVIHIAGFGKACEIAKQYFGKNRFHLLETRNRLLDGLLNTFGDRVSINGNLNNGLPNTLNVSFKNADAHTLVSALGNDLLFSTGSACHSGITEISSVLKAMHVDPDLARGTVRLSTGKFTTAEEIDFSIDILKQSLSN